MYDVVGLFNLTLDQALHRPRTEVVFFLLHAMRTGSEVLNAKVDNCPADLHGLIVTRDQWRPTPN